MTQKSLLRIKEMRRKLVLLLLAGLFLLQLTFNSRVHQITIYTYGLFNNYYYFYNNGRFENTSKSLLANSTGLTNDIIYNLSIIEKSTLIWNKSFTERIDLELCRPALSDEFVPDKNLLSINIGGAWKPALCRSWSSVAVIVPFRYRHQHLNQFLAYMHSFLQSQMNAYQIFVVEQFGNGTFNRAKLMNVGFVEARKLSRFDCYVFHDVDLTPMNGHLLYNCSADGPVHMSAAIDKHNFRMPYGGYFGGATGFTEEQMTKVNGFSNKFFGWGGEDDEIARRISFSGQHVQRYQPNVSKYRMFKHNRDEGNKVNPKRMKILGDAKRNWKKDGLNSLKYKIIKIEQMPLYTKFITDVDESENER